MSDGVHPTDAGKQILCETFAAAIIEKVGEWEWKYTKHPIYK